MSHGLNAVAVTQDTKTELTLWKVYNNIAYGADKEKQKPAERYVWRPGRVVLIYSRLFIYTYINSQV
jgi:hypothetical protein